MSLLSSVILRKAVIKAILSTPRRAGEREPSNCVLQCYLQLFPQNTIAVEWKPFCKHRCEIVVNAFSRMLPQVP